MAQAIINAKAKDSQPGEQHYFPALKETKVYELGEALTHIAATRYVTP